MVVDTRRKKWSSTQASEAKPQMSAAVSWKAMCGSCGAAVAQAWETGLQVDEVSGRASKCVDESRLGWLEGEPATSRQRFEDQVFSRVPSALLNLSLSEKLMKNALSR